MKKANYKREDLYNVIFFYQKEDGSFGAHKLRNILVDRPGSWKSTVEYMKKEHPTLQYANVYGGVTASFKKRIKLL